MVSDIDDLDGLVARGGPLSPSQVRDLARSTNLVRLGMLADQVRRRRHGTATTFVRVCDVTPDVAGTRDLPAGARELRLSGLPASADAAVEIAGALVARAGGTPVTAWSLDDLERLGGGHGLVPLLERLQGAGVAAVAQAPIDRLEDPLAAVAAVPRAGLALARVTIEAPIGLDAVLDLLELVHTAQRATGAIRVFAPLPRQLDAQGPSTGYDDAKVVAVARLYLNGIDSIQVDWQRYGPKLAQVALLFGADDLDSVSPEDDLSQGRRRAPLEEVRRNIAAASLSPVERDGRWRIVAA
jgi:aminodeoxyfutalosine synthase